MTIQQTTLANGLRIVSDFIPTVETVSLGAWFKIGTRHEQSDVNGISHVLEHMAFKGTHKRTATQIAREIEDVGGYLNAYTSRETTAYYARILKQDVPLTIEVLGDILQNSTFDLEELTKEKAVILQEIGQVQDTPDDIVFDYFQETCYPNHPMGWPILGRTEVVQSLQRDTISDYLQSCYGANQMVFAAAGNVNHDALVEQVERYFSNFKRDGQSTFEPARYQGGDYRHHKDLEQVHLVLGFEGVSYYDPHYYTASVLSILLGGGMSSRLFQEIREKRGLVYTIYSAAASYFDSGQFSIYAGTGQNEVKELIPVIGEQLAQLPETLTDEEIKRAKVQLKASLLRALESTSNRCGRLANQVLIYGKPLSTETIIESVEKVDKQDLKQLATQIFRSPPTLTSLGPVQNVLSFEKLAEQLGC